MLGMFNYSSNRAARATVRAVIGLAAAMALLSAPAAQARPARARDIGVVSSFEGPSYATDAQSVRCGPTLPGGCQLEFVGTSTLAGTLSGGTEWTMWGWGNRDGTNEYTTVETFTGTVSGCGTGSFEFTVPDGVVAAEPTEPNFGRRMTSTWSFVTGSGTGELVALTGGHGDIEGVVYPDQSSDGTLSGVLTCRS